MKSKWFLNIPIKYKDNYYKPFPESNVGASKYETVASHHGERIVNAEGYMSSTTCINYSKLNPYIYNNAVSNKKVEELSIMSQKNSRVTGKNVDVSFEFLSRIQIKNKILDVSSCNESIV